MQRAATSNTNRPTWFYRAVQAVRKTGQIKISFTPRAFKTAARESKRGEEEEWLSNQAEARKAVQEAKQYAKDLGVDNDPLWLKDKGNEFFKNGDFRGAINAYTAGGEFLCPTAHVKTNCTHRPNICYVAESCDTLTQILIRAPSPTQ
jgi:hypothetical protein